MKAHYVKLYVVTTCTAGECAYLNYAAESVVHHILHIYHIHAEATPHLHYEVHCTLGLQINLDLLGDSRHRHFSFSISVKNIAAAARVALGLSSTPAPAIMANTEPP